jgi:hypothetical protein
LAEQTGRLADTQFQRGRKALEIDPQSDEFKPSTYQEGTGHSMPPLEQIIYASVATEEFGDPQLAALLQKSRKSNERAGLTGMLLHDKSDGTFFQVIEGEPEAIEFLLQKLLRDPRHSHLTVIIREPIHERSFADWTMGFAGVSSESLKEIPGFNDFFSAGSCFAALDAGRAKKLLAAFAGGRWRSNQTVVNGQYAAQ